MLFRCIAYLCLLASCLSGCVMSVPGDTLPPVDHWPKVDNPRPINVDVDWKIVDADGEDDDYWDMTLKNDPERKNKEDAFVGQVAAKAIEDSRLFSQVSYKQQGKATHQVKIAIRQRDSSWMSTFRSVPSFFTLFLIPSKTVDFYDLEATFTNPFNGSAITLTKHEQVNKWSGLFFVPWVSSHSYWDAYRDVVYRMTQAAIEDARTQGFFDVDETQLEKGFF